jgi:hypothetical protein
VLSEKDRADFKKFAFSSWQSRFLAHSELFADSFAKVILKNFSNTSSTPANFISMMNSKISKSLSVNTMFFAEVRFSVISGNIPLIANCTHSSLKSLNLPALLIANLWLLVLLAL